jgi:hypothetical protein
MRDTDYPLSCEACDWTGDSTSAATLHELNRHDGAQTCWSSRLPHVGHQPWEDCHPLCPAAEVDDEVVLFAIEAGMSIRSWDLIRRLDA